MVHPKGMMIHYRLKMDLKHRVMIPEKLLGSLDSRLYLCTAQNGTAESDGHGLFVYTPEVWEEMMKPENPQESYWSCSQRQRLMQMNTDFVVFDSQRRFTIPQRCVDALHLENEVSIWFAF